MSKATYTLKATNPHGRTMALTFTDINLMLDSELAAIKMGFTTHSYESTKIIKTEAEAMSQLAWFMDV